MERLEFGGHWRHQLRPWKFAERWVRQHCKNLGVPVPRLIVKTVRGARGEYDETVQTIFLDTKFGRSALVLLHELAHHITWIKYPKAEDHGPQFMRIYAALLDATRLVPLAGTRAACKRHGVRIARKL
jgi:hypothetical protein